MSRQQSGFRPRLECLEDRAVPATFSVNTTLDVVDSTDGKRSLREAINAANATPGADVIVLPAGVFRIALPGAGEDSNATGDFDITGAVTIRGVGAGRTIIDAQQLDRVFDILGTNAGAITVGLDKLTVRNGLAVDGAGIRVGNADLVVRDSAVVGNRGSGNGGGISNGAAPGVDVRLVRTNVARNVAGGTGGGLFVIQGSLTVKDSTLRRNVAVNGGGIGATSATLTNSSVSGNSANSDGGGILAVLATLSGCTVSGNFAGRSGGGIYTGSSATLSGCTVSGNFAASDGGGIRSHTAVTMSGCTLSGNSCGGNGGGIQAGANAGSTGEGTATMSGCTVSGNSAAAAGGGIWAGTETTVLTNTTVSGNSAGGAGGGIVAIAATLLNVTVVENLAQIRGGGVFSSQGGLITVKNSLIAQNLVGLVSLGTDPDMAGSAFLSLGHNLIGAGGTGFTDGVKDDIVGTIASPIDPKLGPLQNNGGRTKTHALLAGSRAIDAGDNAGLPATDQRGLARKKDGNGDGKAFVDIGAFER